MKTTLLLLGACLILAACKDNKKGSTLDPYARITLNGTTAASAVAKIAPPASPYSIQTVARWAMDMALYSPVKGQATSRGIYSRDEVAGKITIGDMRDVVDTDGEGGYKLGWIVTEGIYDVVCRANYNAQNLDEWGDPLKDMFSNKWDTIAYVPNSVIRRAEVAIKTAFDAGDYDECMRLFEEAYVFIPITGPEWRALKEAGEE